MSYLVGLHVEDGGGLCMASNYEINPYGFLGRWFVYVCGLSPHNKPSYLDIAQHTHTNLTQLYHLPPETAERKRHRLSELQTSGGYKTILSFSRTDIASDAASQQFVIFYTTKLKAEILFVALIR